VYGVRARSVYNEEHVGQKGVSKDIDEQIWKSDAAGTMNICERG